MSSVVYNSISPYATTPQLNNQVQYLDFLSFPYLKFSTNDTLYTIDKKYENRPDLLSYDLYKTTGYWWIFSVRNPDVIKDPIYDMKAGAVIYLPNNQNLPGNNT